MSAYERIRKALKCAKLLDYTNGMATESVDLETEIGKISVIRKSANPERNEHFLIRIRENEEMGHVSADRKGIEKKIKHMSILDNTDVNIKFKNHYPDDGYNYSAIIPVDIFTFL